MKRIIKKILSESDFDWVSEVEPFDFDTDWIIYFNNPREFIEIQQWLCSHGVFWKWSNKCYVHDTTLPFGFFYRDKGKFESYGFIEDEGFNRMNDLITDFYDDYIKYSWDKNGVNQLNSF